jgi:hypothetical protein
MMRGKLWPAADALRSEFQTWLPGLRPPYPGTVKNSPSSSLGAPGVATRRSPRLGRRRSRPSGDDPAEPARRSVCTSRRDRSDTGRRGTRRAFRPNAPSGRRVWRCQGRRHPMYRRMRSRPPTCCGPRGPEMTSILWSCPHRFLDVLADAQRACRSTPLRCRPGIPPWSPACRLCSTGGRLAIRRPDGVSLLVVDHDLVEDVVVSLIPAHLIVHLRPFIDWRVWPRAPSGRQSMCLPRLVKPIRRLPGW